MRFTSTNLLLRAALAFALVLGPSAVRAHPAVDVVTSNWKFTPATVEAHVGEEMVLNLISSEGVHGVESKDLGIAKTMIVPGQTAQVKFTPKTAGTYNVHCSIVCGAGHENMVLTVKVVP